MAAKLPTYVTHGIRTTVQLDDIMGGRNLVSGLHSIEILVIHFDLAESSRRKLGIKSSRLLPNLL